MKKFLLTQWIRFYVQAKVAVSRIQGYISHTLEEEIAFIKSKNLKSSSMDELIRNGIEYKRDIKNIFGKIIQWDYQFDAINTWERGGADCNSLHRIIQIFCHIRGNESFLVTYIPTDFTKAHATIIIKKEGKFISFDYGRRGKPRSTMEEAIKDVNLLHGSELITYVIQDINWKVV